MTLLYIAIPVALLVAAGAVVAFIWAARGDQYEDLDTPPVRMLLDDAPAKPAASRWAAASQPPGTSTPVPSAHGHARAPDPDAPRVSS